LYSVCFFRHTSGSSADGRTGTPPHQLTISPPSLSGRLNDFFVLRKVFPAVIRDPVEGSEGPPLVTERGRRFRSLPFLFFVLLRQGSTSGQVPGETAFSKPPGPWAGQARIAAGRSWLGQGIFEKSPSSLRGAAFAPMLGSQAPRKSPQTFARHAAPRA